MKVQAQAESGLLIKSVDNNSDKFSTTANAGMTSAQKLYPISTINLSNWWHAVSDTYDNAKNEQSEAGAYTEIITGLESYMVKKTFAIRSADATVPIRDVDLAVTDVTVEASANSTQFLNKAIRVGVKITDESDFYVYAPLQEEGGFELVAVYAKTGDTTPKLQENKAPGTDGDRLKLTTHNNSIPASDSGLSAEVYIWYEGEDPQCKSSNLPLSAEVSIDNLSVSVSFKSVAKQTA